VGLPRCPVCGGVMTVTELVCDRDGTVVRGRFSTSPLASLSPEDEEFILMFLAAKGNLKRLERITGQGYFALRGRLEKIISQLGVSLPDDGEDEPQEEEEDIDPISAFEKGKLGIDDVLRLLKEKKR